jgi:hypothetical protein
MADNSDPKIPTIVQLISTFSDYAGAIGRLHQDALTAYVDKHVELFAAVKPLVTGDDMSAKALGAVLRQQAKDAGKAWTLKDEHLADVMWFGRHHKATSLVTYSGDKIKAEETPTINGYKAWLRRLVAKEIDAKGAETTEGARARKDRDKAKAALAVAKPAMATTVDYLKDMEGLAPAAKLAALMLLRANLDADIAQVERDMGKSKTALATIKETRTATAKARRAAVSK